jgi:6-phosphogluconate dehydrogenase
MASFGVIGLGVMGQNLALNIEEHGFPVAVWNYETSWIGPFLERNPGKRLTGCATLEELARSLERPRRILVMIKAGAPVDSTMEKLAPYLEAGDIVIDGGNSWFRDTQRREAEWAKRGLQFVGCGVSGGEEGARHGPCLMPGGARAAWDAVKPVLEAIAAKTEAGPCVTYVGPDGAGHYVKMVHNGIEYADMQLIAEIYDVLRRGIGLGVDELAAVFDGWNRGRLESYLVELTAGILRKRDDETGKPLVDLVLDEAGQKGTGRWTAQVALELEVPVPTISAAIDARFLSSMKRERVDAARLLGDGVRQGRLDRALVRSCEAALYAAKICAYAQGMALIRAGSDTYHWNIDLAEMARIWKGGCIIRARFLDEIRAAYGRDPRLPNLLLDDLFRRDLAGAHGDLRRVAAAALGAGIPVPALAASLSYFDSYRSAELPQNLTQAQRDAFGAHTYVRIDHPERGAVHTEWVSVEA